MLTAVVGARILLGLSFAAGAASKLRHPLRFRRALEAYSVVPAWAVIPCAFAIPILELVLAALLLGGWRTTAVAGAAAATLLMFTAAVAVEAARSRAIECGCGTWGGTSTTSWPVVMRNVVLIVAAIAAALKDPGSLRALVQTHELAASEPLALLICVIMAGASLNLFQRGRALSQALRRVDRELARAES